VTICSACGKQNQDHYRFCLGCGAELPKGAAPAPAAAPAAHDILDEGTYAGTGPALSPVAARPAPAPAPEPEPAPAAGTCPECQTSNPPTNRFCASCGFKLEVKKAAAPAAAPAPAKVKTAVPSEPLSGFVLIALDAEGKDVGRHDLPRGESFVGRANGGVFSTDAFLSPKHARFDARDGRVFVRDAGSLNGVFRKILAEQPTLLKPGQMFRIGQELLVFDVLAARPSTEDGVVRMGSASEGYTGRVSLVVGRKTASPSVAIPAHGLHLGRERGDVTFPEDGYVSGLHCKVSHEAGETYVTDLGSSNGTFVQLLGDNELKAGDILLMGQQLFRIAT
jgi:pSer/pThr/pTyr-binding forkhead associated (FHA) protein